MKSSKINFAKGFTLIELLVVIAVLGILAAGVLVGIDPVDRINAASDSRAQNDIGTMGRAAEAYATAKNGFYPASFQNMKDNGDIKQIPVQTGYTYVPVTVPVSCTGGVDCTAIVITSNLKSKKFTSMNADGTTFWRYETSSGKSCAVDTAATACP